MDGVLDAVGEREVLFVTKLEEGPSGVANFLVEVGEVAVVDQFSHLLLKIAEAFAEWGVFKVLVVGVGDAFLEFFGCSWGDFCGGTREGGGGPGPRQGHRRGREGEGTIGSGGFAIGLCGKLEWVQFWRARRGFARG